jgi:integrase
MTTSGVTQMVERRAALARIGQVNLHMLRHAAASYAMEHGLGDDAAFWLAYPNDAQQLWRSC